MKTPADTLRSLGLQTLATLVAAALLAVALAPEAALSGLIGGAIAMLGTGVFGLVSFWSSGGDAGAWRLIVAEVLRLLAMGLAFGGAFAAVAEINPAALLGVFLVTHLLPVWWVYRRSQIAMTR